MMSLAGAAARRTQMEALVQCGCVSKGDWFRNARRKSEQMANESLLLKRIFDLRDGTLLTFTFQRKIFLSCLLLMTSRKNQVSSCVTEAITLLRSSGADIDALCAYE